MNPDLCRPRTPAGIVRVLKGASDKVIRGRYSPGDVCAFRPGSGRGLHAAKHTFYKGGTAGAESIIARAEWAGPAAQLGRCIDTGLKPDVLLVEGYVDPAHRKLRLKSPTYLADNLRSKWRWPLVSRTTLVVVPDGDAYTAVALFVTAARDPAIKTAYQHVDTVWEVLRAKGAKVNTTPPEGNNGHSWKPTGRGHDGPTADRPMAMEGWTNRKFSSGIAYFARRKPYTYDELLRHTWHYTCFSALERKHVPGLANFRRSESKAVGSPGCFPGVPLDMMSACCVSLTQNYACDAHADSAKPGMSETVGFTGKGPKNWMFCISEVGVLFDLHSAQKAGGCLLFFPGQIAHGTPPTGHTHTGYGFALISKSRQLGPAAKEFFAKHGRDLILR